MSAAASTASVTGARNRAATAVYHDPLANPNASFVPRTESAFARIEPGAVGSVVVLLALIGALGYGGWSVLQEVQRVQLAPMDQAPVVVAEIDPLGNVQANAPAVRSAPEAVETAAVEDQADRLYRPQALDLPVLTSRDGPISAINPRATSVSATVDVPEVLAGDAPLQVVAEADPGVEILAVRPSWVRVSSADGTVLFEKILDAGERYAVPALEEAPVLRSGNSGSIYFAVNGKTFGPAAPGAQVIKNVSLTPAALMATYAEADLTGDADLAKFITLEAALPVAPSQ